VHKSVLNLLMWATHGIDAGDGTSKFRKTSVLKYRERGAGVESCDSNTRHAVNLNTYRVDFEFINSGNLFKL
jgi:hypothetical protein